MKHTSSTASAAPSLRPVLIAITGIAALTASSYIAVPMYPVPVTMQTLVVVLCGALLGARLGTATVLSWLALALAGAPVLANGAAGPAAFVSPTAGYLASFPIAALLAGCLPRGNQLWAHGSRLAGFLALHGLILAMGWAWLNTFMPAETALAVGVTPFLIGALLKSGLATAFFAVRPKQD